MLGKPRLISRHGSCNLCALYQIDQLITEPTRVTSTLATLIDLILTNIDQNIFQDPALFTLKNLFHRNLEKLPCREVRKNVFQSDFIQDISLFPWDMVYQSAGKYGNRSFSKLLQLIDLPFFE
jgi:hypothetical protein